MPPCLGGVEVLPQQLKVWGPPIRTFMCVLVLTTQEDFDQTPSTGGFVRF